MKKIGQKIGDFFHKLGSHKDALKDVMKNRHRFVVMDEDTYKEKFSFQLTGMNLFVTVGAAIIVLILLTALLIAFTPLRELIPGYSNTRVTKQAYQNALVIDSLEQELANQERQLADIKAIMMGQNPDDLRRDSSKSNQENKVVPKVAAGDYHRSKDDSLLRVEVEREDQYSVRPVKKENEKKIHHVPPTAVQEIPQLFFTPVKGKVIALFDAKTKHYGVDIAGAGGEAVKATMSGTVIFSGFTVETGYVIALQHAGGYISVYKHNSALLRRMGDVVHAGEPIAFIGNSGELTSGPHLHFELWMNGVAVNPLQYISF
ncbi:MAG: M23 family metallopeptidase [Bacteroidales bacterium]|nr:M23 family metallopeptidase [Bacteroidales bacterium]